MQSVKRETIDDNSERVTSYYRTVVLRSGQVFANVRQLVTTVNCAQRRLKTEEECLQAVIVIAIELLFTCSDIWNIDKSLQICLMCMNRESLHVWQEYAEQVNCNMTKYCNCCCIVVQISMVTRTVECTYYWVLSRIACILDKVCRDDTDTYTDIKGKTRVRLVLHKHSW